MEREGIEPEVDRAVDEMESGRGEMEERSDELSGRVDAARNEWHARQSDSQVPGAVAPEEEEEEPADDAEEESPDAEGSGES